MKRMSWIKPNFLWMMYRSNWGRTEGQEVVLAIRLKRSFFDEVLSLAVPSSIDNDLFKTPEEWKRAIRKSEMRLQWDPDHAPSGGKCIRRAIQLGLRGKLLEKYSREAIIEIINVTELVHQYSPYARKPYEGLYTPMEQVYPGK